MSFSNNNKHSSPPSPSPQHNNTNNGPSSSSKLPKFLQRQNHDRSRSKSVSTTSLPSNDGSRVESAMLSTPAPSKFRKGSRFLGRRDKEGETGGGGGEESPVVVEPVAIPRPARMGNPLTSAPDVGPSSSRLGERLSGWFSHTFSSSTTDLSLPSLISAGNSPRSKASALLTVAKHGKGHLDKAMRYLLDSDAVPDKCTDPIWLLGVQHPGYEPPSPVSPTPMTTHAGSIRSSTSSAASNTDIALALSHSSPPSSYSSSKSHNPAAHWPPVFYIDFVSRIWLTYRSHFGAPIKDTTLVDLCAQFENGMTVEQVSIQPVPQKSRWHWGGEKTWSSDSGWGCMLRTGQSLLANALIHAHLGREWRRPPYPVYTADYATYVQILTWFFDTPSPEAPFSVHRMALAGKELGTDVGQWFGPSVAAGAIKRLTSQFPQAGIGVSVAKDGTLSQTDVFLASHTHLPTSSSSHSHSSHSHSPRLKPTHAHQPPPGSTWGDRPVLVLIGLRLGIDGVNPIYYETIKALFTFPQCIGIAGGRPSSSYYFVGSQADNLFYLDPHNPRPAIPLRSPFEGDREEGGDEGGVLDISTSHSAEAGTGNAPPSAWQRAGLERRDSGASSLRKGKKQNRKERVSVSYHVPSSSPPSAHHVQQPHVRVPTSPTSPSPLQRAFSGDSAGSSGGVGSGEESPSPSPSAGVEEKQRPPRPTARRTSDREQAVPISVVLSQSSTNTTSTTTSAAPTTSTSNTNNNNPSLSTASNSSSMLTPLQEHYVTSYGAAELKTYHCERVRKMPLSGLDPSMLLGFLCRTREEWEGLRRRVEELPKTIFSIQNDHPRWAKEDYDDESMMGLESMSDPEEEDDDEEDGESNELGNEDDEDDEDELDMDLGDEEEGERKRRRTKKANKSLLGDEDEDEDFYEPEPPGSVSRSTSESTSSHHSRGFSHGTEEGDTEEDPVEALTPGPNSKFDLSSTAAAGVKGKGSSGKGKAKQHEPVGGDDDDDVESDIEDGWVDSVDFGEEDEEEVVVGEEEGEEGEGEGEFEAGVVTPLAGSTVVVGNGGPTRPSHLPTHPNPTFHPNSPAGPARTASEPPSPRTPRSPGSSSMAEQGVVVVKGSSNKAKSKTKPSSSSAHAKSKPDSGSRQKKKKKESKRAVPVPIISPPLRSASSSSSSTAPQQQQQHFPFPGSGPDGDLDEPESSVETSGGAGPGVGPGTRSWERGRYESQSWAGPGPGSGVNSTGGGGSSGTGGLRMFAGKGRDGGRTQSGGVKGILTDG